MLAEKSRICRKLRRRKILKICVFSVLLYISETWTLKQTDKKKLLAFEMKCYRRILQISWKDIVRNIDRRRQIAAQGTMTYVVKKRKLRLFGHICRMVDNKLVKHTLFARINGKCRRDRPCREWMDDITEWCGRIGHDVFHLAQDRRQ